MKRAHVVIDGRVQGVWFRAHTRDNAAKFGICGWVRNRSDGCVEAVFEGPEDSVNELIAWCHRGSPLARVDEVTVTWENPKGCTEFRVKH